MKTRSFFERLDEKSAQALLTNHFRERYNYNPAMAEAIFKDAVFVRTLPNPTTREDGQIIQYFPKAMEPAGKPLKNCEYITVVYGYDRLKQFQFARRPYQLHLRAARVTTPVKKRETPRTCGSVVLSTGAVSRWRDGFPYPAGGPGAL